MPDLLRYDRICDNDSVGRFIIVIRLPTMERELSDGSIVVVEGSSDINS
jgi:hypothetical protein